MNKENSSIDPTKFSQQSLPSVIEKTNQAAEVSLVTQMLPALCLGLKEKKFMSFLRIKFPETQSHCKESLNNSKGFCISRKETSGTSRGSTTSQMCVRISSVLPIVDNHPEEEIDSCDFGLACTYKLHYDPITHNDSRTPTFIGRGFPNMNFGNENLQHDKIKPVSFSQTINLNELSADNDRSNIRQGAQQECIGQIALPLRCSSLRKKESITTGSKKTVTFSNKRTVFRYTPLA